MYLAEIDQLVSKLFVKSWLPLRLADSFVADELRYPGVYLLAYTDGNLTGAPVKTRDIFYVGMSNSAGGVAQRLKQFLNGIEKNRLHSGAMRFYRQYCRGVPFSNANTGKKFYYVSLTLECVSNKGKASPDDFRELGHVACLEYYAIAHVFAETGNKPPLNKLGVRDEVIE